MSITSVDREYIKYIYWFLNTEMEDISVRHKKKSKNTKK
jgi:hypothetical protein